MCEEKEEKKVVVTVDALEKIGLEVVEAFTDLREGAGAKLIGEIVDLVSKKNADYGDAWQKYGIFTPLIRLNDKLLRVKNLTGGKQALIADESVEDTLRDIIGYCLLGLLWLSNERDK